MNRYEKSWRFLWNKLPRWKRIAFAEDMALNKESDLFNEFVKRVVDIAEGVESIPETPSYAEEYEPTFHEKNS